MKCEITMRNTIILKTIIILCSVTHLLLSDTNLSSFIEELYTTHKNQIYKISQPFIKSQLEKCNIASADHNVQDHLVRLAFYHSLFTSKDASDCAKGGVLDIPYFWHWVEPNPRYSILYLPDSNPLVKTKPPKGFEKYKSFADIDRLPAIYLKNLVADSALFFHPDCGEIFTFGWCSEREMAFSNLMTNAGYDSKIKQIGIHVWSEIALDVKSPEGVRYIAVKIDNTFNSMECEVLKVPEHVWKNDFGEGAQVAWYNKKALSENELSAVRNITVSETAKSRINKMVTDWLY